MRIMIAGLLCAAMLPAPARADPIDDAFAPWSGTDRPGCAVAIAQAGSPPILRAYGMADLERAVPITVDTIFETGSVAKQFTAAAVLMLVEDEALSLTDDIRKFLPEMPDYGRPITIDHLLTHTSGLRDWSDLVDFGGSPRYSRVYSNADALLLASRQRALNHPTGARYSYTNTGYNLLAVIVERATGRSLADVTRDRIFVPLGMTHSAWRDDYRRIVPGRAQAYVKTGDALVLGLPMENAYGSGGMLTTVGDLIKWEEALQRGTLGAFVTAKMQEATRLNDGRAMPYGRGLVLGSYGGRREIFHNGGTNGYQSWAGRYPDQGLTIAMLCNGRTIGPDTQVRKLVDRILPPVSADPPGALPDTAELGSRTGLYLAEEPFDMIELVAKDGILRTTSGTPLKYLAPGRYRMGGTELLFSPHGLQRQLSDGNLLTFARLPKAPPSPAELATLAGRYQSDEVSGVFDLKPNGAALELANIERPGVTELLTPLAQDRFAGSGYLMRILRHPDGRVRGVRFETNRVYALDFARVDAPRGNRK